MQSLKLILSYKKPMLAKHKEELDEICEVLDQDLQCVADYIKSCFLPKEKEALGDLINKSMELIRDLCDDGPFKTEYLRHAECVGRIYDEDHCNDSYYQLINMSTLPVQQMQLRKYCW
uniref:DUF19 domain-containing protein n=1 Tax=Strigamia maritima TaxID=126957 RepID=T1JAI4_STRMM